MSDLTKDTIEAAKTQILSYLKNPTQGRMLGHLIVVVLHERLGFQPGDRVEGLSLNRVLDRALQSLRKAGKIEHRDRQWILSESATKTG